MHYFPPDLVPAVLLRTRVLQEEDGGWLCLHVVVGEEGRGSGGGGEWKKKSRTDDVISSTTVDSDVWRCPPLLQSRSVGER